MSEFSDKVAVITGAASGIGQAIAEKFAREGMKVVISDIENEKLSQTREELERIGSDILCVLADVSHFEDVKELAQKTIDQFGVVHILVNNAGVGFAGNSCTSIWETPISQWQWILGVNLWGVIHGVHVFTPIMLKQDIESFIINTCSLAGLISPAQYTNIYAISKHAVIALTEALKTEIELISKKIKVLALCPAFVSTGLCESERNRPEEYFNEIEKTPELEKAMDIYHQSLAKGIPPAQVADILFQSLNGEKFYIPTDMHRFFRSNVKRRMEAIMRDLQK
jgi:NAD(P)-dependent dehydrogenase (short-subunit alcohol dehydrogenase family)